MADTTHDLQARVEGVAVDAPPTVEFLGQRFKIAERVGLMPLMRFAHISRKGVDSDDMEGLAAMYALLRDCIDTTRPQKPVLEGGQTKLDERGQPVTEDVGPSEWDRFEQHAIEAKAEGDDLFQVVTDVIEALSARPTRRPSDSSDGPPITSRSSKAISSSRAPVPPPVNGDPQEWAEVVPLADILRQHSEPARSTA